MNTFMGAFLDYLWRFKKRRDRCLKLLQTPAANHRRF
jgi:hypothetical protein